METRRGCERFEWNPLFAAVEVFFPYRSWGRREWGLCSWSRVQRVNFPGACPTPRTERHCGMSPSSTGNHFPHSRRLFPFPEKGTFESIMSKFSAKFPGRDGCHVPVSCGRCLVITSCTRATDDVSLLPGWGDMQDNRAASLRLQTWAQNRHKGVRCGVFL